MFVLQTAYRLIGSLTITFTSRFRNGVAMNAAVTSAAPPVKSQSPESPRSSCNASLDGVGLEIPMVRALSLPARTPLMTGDSPAFINSHPSTCDDSTRVKQARGLKLSPSIQVTRLQIRQILNFFLHTEKGTFSRKFFQGGGLPNTNAMLPKRHNLTTRFTSSSALVAKNASYCTSSSPPKDLPSCRNSRNHPT